MGAEKRFEGKLTAWLESIGVYPLGTEQQKMTVPPIGYYMKRWGGGKYVKAGLPDYQIVVNGMCIEVETKAENGVVSQLQKQKIEQINASNGTALVLYPSGFDDFKKIVDGVMKSVL